MTIRLVIFDLDGVLVELKESHYLCLNSALKEECGDEMCINLDDHYKIYDGLPTRDKLKLLTRYKNLDEKLYGDINKSKQRHTLKYIFENIKPLPHIGSLLQKLKEDDYKICVATNSVANTAYSVLVKMELLHLVDKVFSNEDVKFSKPQQELYEYVRLCDNSALLEQHVQNIGMRYFADILLPGTKKIVEFHGDYWHCNPKTYSEDYFHKVKHKAAKEIWEEDLKRKHILETHGYTLLYVWESDFKNNLETVQTQIKEFINE